MKPRTQFFAEGNLSESVKGEWMAKEEGSYEDAGKPQGEPNNNHVYNILACSPKGKWRCYNRKDAETLLNSAGYHTEWDGDTKEERALMNAAARVKATLKELLT